MNLLLHHGEKKGWGHMILCNATVHLAISYVIIGEITASIVKHDAFHKIH